MAEITDMTMEEYKKLIRKDNIPGLLQPEIPATAKFKLKGHILAMFKCIMFFVKDHDDAFKHIDEVIDISNYFNVPNVISDAVLLRMLPVTPTGDAKIWLKSL